MAATPETPAPGKPTGLWPAAQAPAAATPAPDQSKSDLISLPSGAELDESGAAKLAAAKPVRLIVTTGPVDAGKTTLLTSLYELFQSAPVANHLFAGSLTLPAFEKRCHLSRTASGADSPDTPRTPFGDTKYLHLAVCSGSSPKTCLDLLFTDVSGEAFERAKDSTAECERLSFLKRADHLLMLLDGEKLVRDDKRWATAQDSTTLLQSFLDSGMLAARCMVKVVFSKYDCLLAAAADKESCETFWAATKKKFETKFGNRLASLQFAEIAARPKRSTALDFGHRLPELLTEWVALSPRSRLMDFEPQVNLPMRESEAFAARHFNRLTAS